MEPAKRSCAGVERAAEGVEVFAPEDLGEGADGEEKAGRRRDPARAVGGEGAARDDAVQMEVLRQILPPGVQDGRAAEVAAEMAGIAAEGGEGVGGGVEEEGVEEPGVALREGVEGMRQGEDEMEVLDGQQLRAAGVEPALFGEGLAFGTVTVAAGVVGDALGPAGVTGLAMAAEGGGAAGLDGAHGAALGAGQPMGLPIRRAMGAEDVGELHRGAAPGPAPRGGRAPGASGGYDAGRLRQIQGRDGAEHAPLAEVEVAHRGGDVLVAEQELDGVQVAAGFQQVGGEGVAQGMDAALLADAGAQFRGGVDLLGDGDVDRARALAIGEEPDAAAAWSSSRRATPAAGAWRAGT